jgi:hypothetical protein
MGNPVPYQSAVNYQTCLYSTGNKVIVRQTDDDDDDDDDCYVAALERRETYTP